MKLLLTLSLVHTENICCDVMPHDVITNIFAYGPHSRLIRAYYWNFYGCLWKQCTFETHSKWAIGNMVCISLASRYVLTLPIGKILGKYSLFT